MMGRSTATEHRDPEHTSTPPCTPWTGCPRAEPEPVQPCKAQQVSHVEILFPPMEFRNGDDLLTVLFTGTREASSIAWETCSVSYKINMKYRHHTGPKSSLFRPEVRESGEEPTV